MPDGLSFTWSWSPGVIIFLLILTLLYLLGLSAARKNVARDPQQRPISPLRIFAFCAAIVIAALLLLSPINTIARTQLFSVHMAQAVILTTVCAPLLLAGCPAALLLPLTEMPIVRGIVRFLTFPLVASVLFNANFLLWHTPRLFGYAMADPMVYHTVMLSIFLTALLNWWPLIGSLHSLRNMTYPVQMLYAFFDGQPVDIFAFVLVFSGTPIFTHYAIPPALHLSAFADQAVAGALLLIPGLVDLGVMSPLFFRWLGQIEHRTRQSDQRRQEEFEDEEDDGEDGILSENVHSRHFEA